MSVKRYYVKNCNFLAFLFACLIGDECYHPNISSFNLATSGVPTSFQNQSGPNQSIGVVADPSAKFLYVSDFENSAVQAFTINRFERFIDAGWGFLHSRRVRLQEPEGSLLTREPSSFMSLS